MENLDQEIVKKMFEYDKIIEQYELVNDISLEKIKSKLIKIIENETKMYTDLVHGYNIFVMIKSFFEMIDKEDKKITNEKISAIKNGRTLQYYMSHPEDNNIII
jgi:hypothetical protein